jgi:hypothetical protein
VHSDKFQIRADCHEKATALRPAAQMRIRTLASDTDRDAGNGEPGKGIHQPGKQQLANLRQPP